MKTILAAMLAVLSLPAFTQVAINSDATPPPASALLEVKSITKGLLIPRMTGAQMQAIAAPAAGLMVYNTNAKAVFVYNGGSWTLTPSATALVLRDTDVHTWEEANSLEKLMQLQGVSFTWKNNPEMGSRIGFVAQDFEKVLPELTFANPADGYKGINYAEVTAVLTEAVKDLKSENDHLKARLDKLEKFINEKGGR